MFDLFPLKFAEILFERSENKFCHVTLSADIEPLLSSCLRSCTGRTFVITEVNLRLLPTFRTVGLPPLINSEKQAILTLAGRSSKSRWTPSVTRTLSPYDVFKGTTISGGPTSRPCRPMVCFIFTDRKHKMSYLW